MNFTAKNLLTINQTNPTDLGKINQKVVDEILERALKVYRKKNSGEIMPVVQKLKNCNDVIELIGQQRLVIGSRKINCNSPRRIPRLNPPEYKLETLEPHLDHQ